MRKHIYDKDWRYSFLRIFWTDWAIRHSYRKLEICGTENIPSDGAVIISANHCNTLMDALVILSADSSPKVFGARADIFRRPLLGKIMSFLRILPMVRQRDGLRNVLKNNETQEIIVDTLKNGMKFCLFPEGTHRTRHSLQRLGKGIFRIALAANENFGENKPVYIVPAGIEYGDYFRFRSTCMVKFGKAINVTEFLKDGNFESEPHAIEALRHELASRMSDLITFIPDNDDYDGKWALTRMLAIYKAKRGYGQFRTSLQNSMSKNREIAASIEKALDHKPETTAEIIAKAEKFDRERRAKKISIYSFRKMNPTANAIGKGIAALLGLPYFIFSAVASLPMWALEMKIRNSVKDAAFRNTVSFGIKLGLTYLMLAIYAVLAFCLAPWWLAASLLVLFMPSYSYFHDYIEGCRRWFSDIRLLKNKGLYKDFKSIVKEFRHITKVK